MATTSDPKPQPCLIHSKPSEFYCKDCNTLICQECTDTTHSKGSGQHTPIRISQAFENLQKTVTNLKEEAETFIEKIQGGLSAADHNENKLKQSKGTCLTVIDNHIQELIKNIELNGNEKKNKVEEIYRKKKDVNDKQIHEFKTVKSDVETMLYGLDELFKQDKATAVKSSDGVITALKNKLREQLPKTEPNDDGQIFFFRSLSSLQRCNIGNVTQAMATCLELKGGEDVTQGQTIVVEIIKTDECEIEADKLKATWTFEEETNITEVEVDNGSYTVGGICTSPGVCNLDVSVDGKSIKQSPMSINVQTKGLVNTIKTNEKNVTDVVMCEDNRLLVSFLTNKMVWYKQSGEYISQVLLPQRMKVNRMYRMQNGDIYFTDTGNKCISIFKTKEEIESIIEDELNNPGGIHVDEASNDVYVADGNSVYVCNNIRSQITSTCNITDVALTSRGNRILLCKGRFGKCTLEIIDNERKNIIEIKKVSYPQALVVDADDNIIISCQHKLLLFNRDGNFITRIDKDEDGIKNPNGLTIISYHPRRVAVANKGDNTIKIFNY